ncbi:glycosyltransferase [Magnetospirillum sp. UT-4]|uniref:glycosyltransferase n=1 Tax=Magnetospirillum sp. UT-4 TaxID=2681467 RepID=UPI001573DD09|nr:glycosyltransferase [Magnetospirillum sp. UT-4]
MTALPTVTVLTASYNDWPSLRALLPLLDSALADRAAAVRVVVVDDGSSEPPPDDLMVGLDLRVIRSLEVLTLVRNLGNQRALSVAVGWVAVHCGDDWVVVMDCDHEDRPEVIPDLLDAAREAGGRKIAFAARTQRHDGLMFKFLYGAYKRLYKLLTGMPIAIGNFSVVPGALMPRLAGVWEIGLHFPAGVMKARLPYTSIGAARGKRVLGRSSMNIVNLVVHGLSGLAVHAETVAVRVVLATLSLGAFATLYLGQVLFEKLFTDIPLLGWTSQIAALVAGFLVQALLSGLLLLFLVLNARTQRPFIPLRDHEAFILAVKRHSAGDARHLPPPEGQDKRTPHAAFPTTSRHE